MANVDDPPSPNARRRPPKVGAPIAAPGASTTEAPRASARAAETATRSPAKGPAPGAEAAGQEKAPEHLGSPAEAREVTAPPSAVARRSPGRPPGSRNKAKGVPLAPMDPDRAARTGRAAAFLFCQPFKLVAALTGVPEIDVTRDRTEAEKVFTEYALDRGDFLGDHGPEIKLAAFAISSVVQAFVAYSAATDPAKGARMKKWAERQAAAPDPEPVRRVVPIRTTAAPAPEAAPSPLGTIIPDSEPDGPKSR